MEIPFIFLNAAITLDGKIATKTGDCELSSEEDWEVVHNLRNRYQGLMIGGNTARIDDPKLTIKEKYIPKDTPLNYPTRILVDSKALLKSDANCLTYMPEIKTIIGVSNQASETNITRLENAGAEIVQTGVERVDLASFMEILKEKYQINDIMLEGGGMLIWSMLELKLLKKFRFYVAPRISGGEEAVSIVRGRGYSLINESPSIKFTKSEKLGNGLEIEGIFQY
ncbi:MAG: dihydrofolate reductase family protein [Candidatus Hodarchaeales archaeon]|jgi:2,5-diamino-6-hydroxy-4-(5-phosphoribosylamino)pyrimidine 1'-reductase